VLILFGGTTHNSFYLNDVWLLSIDPDESQELQWVYAGELEPRPDPRWGHTAVAYANKVFVFGKGFSCDSYIYALMACYGVDGRFLFDKVGVQPVPSQVVATLGTPLTIAGCSLSKAP